MKHFRAMKVSVYVIYMYMYAAGKSPFLLRLYILHREERAKEREWRRREKRKKRRQEVGKSG